MRRKVAVLAIILFYVLHQDFWLWREARPLVLGFLPVGLFYHVMYVLASAGLLWFLVTYFWPSHLDRE